MQNIQLTCDRCVAHMYHIEIWVMLNPNILPVPNLSDLCLEVVVSFIPSTT